MSFFFRVRTHPCRSRRTASARAWAACMIVALIGSGCTAKRLPQYPFEPVAGAQGTGEIEDGLVVSVWSLSDAGESEAYFGKDLLADAGVLALPISVENRSRGSSFMIDPDRIVLKDRTRGKPDLDQVASYAAGKAVSTAGVVCVLLCPIASLALIPTGAKMISSAGERRHNFVCKELRTTTLSPGETAHGFVYFTCSGGDSAGSHATLHVEALDLKAHEWRSIDLPVAWNR